MKYLILLSFLFCFSFQPEIQASAISHFKARVVAPDHTSSSELSKKEARKVSRLKKRLKKWQERREGVSGFKKFLFLFLIPYLLVAGLVKLIASTIGGEIALGELALLSLGGYAIVVFITIAMLLIALGNGPNG